MNPIDQFLKENKAQLDELARVDNKPLSYLWAINKYNLYGFLIAFAIFATALYWVNNAESSAGIGWAWLWLIVSSIVLISLIMSSAEVLLEIRKRRIQSKRH